MSYLDRNDEKLWKYEKGIIIKHFQKKTKKDFSPVIFYPLNFDVLQQLNESSHWDGTNGIGFLFFSSLFFSYSKLNSKKGDPRKSRKKSVRISMRLSVQFRGSARAEHHMKYRWIGCPMRLYILGLWKSRLSPHPFSNLVEGFWLLLSKSARIWLALVPLIENPRLKIPIPSKRKTPNVNENPRMSCLERLQKLIP